MINIVLSHGIKKVAIHTSTSLDKEKISPFPGRMNGRLDSLLVSYRELTMRYNAAEEAMQLTKFQQNNNVNFFSLLSGNPPQCKAWAGQCFLYLWAVIIEKATITLVVQLNFWEEVRRFILLPVKHYPRVELAISMLIIPFVFNVSKLFEL